MVGAADVWLVNACSHRCSTLSTAVNTGVVPAPAGLSPTAALLLAPVDIDRSLSGMSSTIMFVTACSADPFDCRPPTETLFSADQPHIG